VRALRSPDSQTARLFARGSFAALGSHETREDLCCSQLHVRSGFHCSRPHVALEAGTRLASGMVAIAYLGNPWAVARNAVCGAPSSTARTRRRSKCAPVGVSRCRFRFGAFGRLSVHACMRARSGCRSSKFVQIGRKGTQCYLTSESSLLPSVARLATAKRRCSRLIRGVSHQDVQGARILPRAIA
jgi:hypothetical protein